MLLGLVSSEEHFVLDPPLHWQPVKVLGDRSDVVSAHGSHHPSCNILGLLQFADCTPDGSSYQSIVEVQLWCHKSVDDPLIRALSRNLLILAMFPMWYCADWYRVGLFMWETMVMLVSNVAPNIPRWCHWSNEGVTNHHTRQWDILQLLMWPNKENVCLAVIELKNVPSHPGANVLAKLLQSINGDTTLGPTGPNKHTTACESSTKSSHLDRGHVVSCRVA